MSDYTKTTNFTAKDALSSGDPLKLIKGSYFDTEFDNIATAIATKYDSNDFASDVEAKALTSESKLLNPHTLNDVLTANGGMLSDIQAMTDPGADMLLGWDETGNAIEQFTMGNALEFNGNTIRVASTIAGDGLAWSSGVLSINADQGVKIESDTVRLSDVADGAGQPIDITNGTLTFTGANIAELTISGMDDANDAFLVFDTNTLKRMPYDEGGIKVKTVTGATDTIAQADMNHFIHYTDASGGVTVTLNSGVGDVGNILVLKQGGGSTVTITGTATVESADSHDSTRAQNSVIVLVCQAADTWALYGDTA